LPARLKRKRSMIAGAWRVGKRSTRRFKRETDQLDGGEGVPEDRLDTYLSNMKAKPKRGRPQSGEIHRSFASLRMTAVSLLRVVVVGCHRHKS
jgi:hypothetical protein